MAQPAPLKTIGVRFPEDSITAIAKDAKRLGLTPTEWMRMAGLRQLATPVSKEEAEEYRTPPTKKALREQLAAATNGKKR